MNIVLIHPYIIVRDLETYLSEPLGLMSLATYLKKVFKEEVNVSILDLYAKGADRPVLKGDMFIKGISSESEIVHELEQLKPDLIGITCCFTGYFGEALAVAQIARNYFPSAPVVMGGAHATLQAEQIIQENSYVDFVVCNEGEFTLAELVQRIRDNTSPETLAGICFRNANGDVVRNPERELIKDLDVLPIPDRSLIDMEHYKQSNSGLFNYHKASPIATIMTSRGCPYECIFCCTKNMWRRRWRPIGLRKVFTEIEILVKEYGIREIVILDDQFIMKKERIYEFCDYFAKKKLGITFSNVAGISTWLADNDDLLRKMRQIGFYKITLPIESANSNTIKFIRKSVNLPKIQKLIAKANRLGYWTGAFFIIGFPYETREQIMETVEFAFNSDLDFAHFFVAQPYIGTELYTVFEKEGLLKDPFIPGTYIFKGWHDTLTMTADELNEIQTNATGKWLTHKIAFYLKPSNFIRHLLPKISTPDRLRYSLRIFIMLASRKLKSH